MKITENPQHEYSYDILIFFYILYMVLYLSWRKLNMEGFMMQFQDLSRHLYVNQEGPSIEMNTMKQFNIFNLWTHTWLSCIGDLHI